MSVDSHAQLFAGRFQSPTCSSAHRGTNFVPRLINATTDTAFYSFNFDPKGHAANWKVLWRILSATKKNIIENRDKLQSMILIFYETRTFLW